MDLTFIKKVFLEKRIELEKIEPEKGIDGRFKNFYVTKSNCKDKEIESYLLDSTVILGWDEKKNKGSGSGEWDFKIDKRILKYIKSINLKITSIRTHEGLHTPEDCTKNELVGVGSVYINDRPIDKNIELQKEMSKGKDLGMHEVGPYPIINWINKKNEIYKIKLKVNNHALWGIDEISMEPVVERWRIRTIWSLVVGAFFSGLIGLAFFNWRDILGFLINLFEL
jgi:hypothetical protein